MSDRYAVITGASKGIGLSLAREVAHRGWNLILVSLPEEDLENIAQILSEEFNVRVKFAEIDLTESGAVKQVADWCDNENVQINLLINNAGLGYEADFNSNDPAFYTYLLTINVLVPTELVRRLLPLLKKNKESWILNTGSLASFYPLPYKSVYAASKSYLTSFTESLHMELANDNIAVSVLCPAGVDTSTATSKRIDELGWKAKKGRMTTSQVARSGVKNLLKGKRIIIPGRFNYWVFFLSFLVPRRMKYWMINRAWRKYRKKEPELQRIERMQKSIEEEIGCTKYSS